MARRTLFRQLGLARTSAGRRALREARKAIRKQRTQKSFLEQNPEFIYREGLRIIKEKGKGPASITATGAIAGAAAYTIHPVSKPKTEADWAANAGIGASAGIITAFLAVAGMRKIRKLFAIKKPAENVISQTGKVKKHGKVRAMIQKSAKLGGDVFRGFRGGAEEKQAVENKPRQKQVHSEAEMLATRAAVQKKIMLAERQEFEARKSFIKKALKSGVTREGLKRVLDLAGKEMLSTNGGLARAQSLLARELAYDSSTAKPAPQIQTSTGERKNNLQLRTMGRRELIRVLMSMNVVVDPSRGKGSHTYLRNPKTGMISPLTIEKDFGPPVISKTLRQLGIDREAFLLASTKQKK